MRRRQYIATGTMAGVLAVYLALSACAPAVAPTPALEATATPTATPSPAPSPTPTPVAVPSPTATETPPAAALPRLTPRLPAYMLTPPATPGIITPPPFQGPPPRGGPDAPPEPPVMVPSFVPTRDPETYIRDSIAGLRWTEAGAVAYGHAVPVQEALKPIASRVVLLLGNRSLWQGWLGPQTLPLSELVTGKEYYVYSGIVSELSYGGTEYPLRYGLNRITWKGPDAPVSSVLSQYRYHPMALYLVEFNPATQKWAAAYSPAVIPMEVIWRPGPTGVDYHFFLSGEEPVTLTLPGGQRQLTPPFSSWLHPRKSLPAPSPTPQQ